MPQVNCLASSDGAHICGSHAGARGDGIPLSRLQEELVLDSPEEAADLCEAVGLDLYEPPNSPPLVTLSRVCC